MKKYQVFTVLAITFLFSVSAYAGQALDDQQLDMVTAGSFQVWNASFGRVNGAGGVVDNSITIDRSDKFFGISNSDVDIRSVTSTVGNSNIVASGVNVMGVVGRAPGSPSGSSSPNLGSLQTVNQTNIFY